ncbi:MAG: PIN domain-containing protein [Bacillota bacterium]
MHLFIDTNIYMFCALLTKNNYGPNLLKNLLEILENKDITLIVPEVVELEFYRKLDQEFERLKKSINNYSEKFKNNFPSYLEEDKSRIYNQIDNLVIKREKSIEETKKVYNRILQHNNTKVVELSEEIITNSYRRSLKGLEPSSLNSNINGINPDVLIVESIIKFYKKNTTKRFIFCSDNIKDFAEFNNEKNVHILHSDISDDLPNKSIFYRKLPRVLSNEFNEEINEAYEEKINEEVEELKFNLILSKWGDVLNTIKKIRIKVYAFLVEGELIKIKNGKLIIKYKKEYIFHKENIEKYTDLIEDIILEVTDQQISLNLII